MQFSNYYFSFILNIFLNAMICIRTFNNLLNNFAFHYSFFSALIETTFFLLCSCVCIFLVLSILLEFLLFFHNLINVAKTFFFISPHPNKYIFPDFGFNLNNSFLLFALVYFFIIPFQTFDILKCFLCYFLKFCLFLSFLGHIFISLQKRQIRFDNFLFTVIFILFFLLFLFSFLKM